MFSSEEIPGGRPLLFQIDLRDLWLKNERQVSDWNHVDLNDMRNSFPATGQSPCLMFWY